MGTDLPSEGDAGGRTLAGSCGCGAVRYQVADEFPQPQELE
jgi:hypothetical protein